ncbi:hypothetical protein F5I97DRAFT_1810885 [Phlebopus sp. FC_14]|nr:hypothetical protein F5I97DRAFT_1810885 [Phlebopus sp. FC_14]
MQTVSSTTADLSKLTVPQLKALCRERCIIGYSKLSKAALVQKLSETPVTSTPARHSGAVSSGSSNSLTKVPTVKDGASPAASHVAQETTALNPLVHLSTANAAIKSSSRIPTTAVTKTFHCAKRLAHTVDSIPKKRHTNNSTVEELHESTTPSGLTIDSCSSAAHTVKDQPVPVNGPLDVKMSAVCDSTQRLGAAKRFQPLITSVRKSPIARGQSTITQSQTNMKVLSPQSLTSTCFDVPPLENISLPPKTSDRKRVYRWAIILSMLLDEDRKACCLVSRMFRYAVYLSAAHILSKKYPGRRLDVVSNRYSPKVTNMWPYLRLRDDEVDYRRQAFKASFLGKFACSLSFDPLFEHLWSSPDDERQVEIALRFVLTRMWFAVSVGTYGHNSSAWTKDTVQNVTEIVKGEIWQVDVRSSKATETFYVLEATCEVIGHARGLGRSVSAAPNVLRTDWSSYISHRLSQESSVVSSRSLLDSITFSNSEDYHHGMSKVWLQRISREGEMGDAKRRVAEKYILACVVANSVSGRWMSANAMAQEFAGLPETGFATTRSKAQSVNMYLPAHHHVESVHFTTSCGQDLHPVLAVVQTTQREYYILRENGMQVGCEEDGVADIWMHILQCDSQGQGLLYS